MCGTVENQELRVIPMLWDRDNSILRKIVENYETVYLNMLFNRVGFSGTG